MTTEDPIDLYGRANPVPDAAKPSSSEPAAEAALKEIIMTTTRTTTHSNDSGIVNPSGARGAGSVVELDPGRRPRRWLGYGAAAAAVAVIAAGGLLALPGGTELAAADTLLAASRNTADAPSGAIQTEVVQEAPGFGKATTTVEQLFDGDDASLRFSSDIGGFEVETIVADGVLYERVGGEDWQQGEVTGGAEAPIVATKPDVVAFVEGADEVTDCDEAGDAVVSYCVTTDDVEELSQLLPIDFVEEDGVTSAQVRFNVDAKTESVSSIEVDAEAVTPAGEPGTITVDIRYDGLGEPQGIEAPPLG